ncbi:hypothetical protein KSP40_PGU001715 [Platanthera guangdongensis]|uniref:HMA domain-containing protein n=1 Tax=Platanthera guangdongensis TaxID=2320717 RepID=A0ABR2M7W8_9ASPA
MAPPPAGTDLPEIQTVALKVSIHCEGCKKKVKKVLQRVEGVGRIDIDSKQNKVTVTGSANGESLIQKLCKYGKQAEIWPDSKPSAAGKSSGEPKEDENENAASAASSTATVASPETEQQKQQPEQKQQAEESKPAPPPPAETTKAAPAVPATATSGDVTASKDSIDPPELKPSEPPAKSEMPVLASDSDDSKKKGKKVEIVKAPGDESAVSDTVAGINPPASYIMSYSTVRPSISYSHYAPSPAIPSSYTTYSGHPPPADAFDLHNILQLYIGAVPRAGELLDGIFLLRVDGGAGGGGGILRHVQRRESECL